VERPLAATHMGLIYVDPETASAANVRLAFSRMAMDDKETVALIGISRAFVLHSVVIAISLFAVHASVVFLTLFLSFVVFSVAPLRYFIYQCYAIFYFRQRGDTRSDRCMARTTPLSVWAWSLRLRL
jgi:hypothetical protein